MSPGALVAGDKIAGRYLIEELLGRGGMGEVYRARQEGLRREVAIKVILPKVAGVPGARDRFEREARVAALLDHPSAVQIFDFGEDNGRLYLAMELLRGRLLSDIIDDGGAMPVARALPIATGLADLLCAAHQAGLVHRDLKPDNIMIDVGPHGPRVRIMDFGLAFMTESDGNERLGRMTKLSLMAGTPDYMSPEQARGLPDVGPPTDIYALGCVLYEMLSGETPHRGDHTADVVVRHLYVDPERLSERVGELSLPESLSDFVSSMLAKEPDARPTAEQVFAFLSDFDVEREERKNPARRDGVGRASRMISEPAPGRTDTLPTFSENYVGGRPRIGFARATEEGPKLLSAIVAGGFRVCPILEPEHALDCDVVLLFPGSEPEAVRAFVATGKPVIAVVPPGDAEALTPLLQAGVADVVYSPLKPAMVTQKAWRAVRRAHRA